MIVIVVVEKTHVFAEALLEYNSIRVEVHALSHSAPQVLAVMLELPCVMEDPR